MVAIRIGNRCRLVASAVLALALAGGGAVSAQAQTSAQAWTTPWAKKLGVVLEKSFDSSGPDAWDPKKNPLVFVTSEGPGYGGLLSGVKLPGFAIINADTRKVVAHKNYDVLGMGWRNVMEPHGLGVSSDGKWIYLPTGEGSFGTKGKGRLLIINARTLKLDKMLKLQSNPHHAKAFSNGAGKTLTLVESFRGGLQPTFALDPANDNKVVGGVEKSEVNKKGSGLGFVSPDGEELFIVVGNHHLPPKQIGKTGKASIYRIDTETWKRTGIIAVPDGNPIWTAFSSNGRYAYFSGSHGSNVFKYDRTENAVISYARAGVEGPYGIHLGWRDRYLFSVGKGESSHNRGRVLGMIDTKLMEKPRGTSPMDQFTTNCIRGDHATLHPDPEANELWITCNSSFEIVIFDLDQRKVTARIPMPNGGSTHSGSFVQYAGWKGEVVSDQNGLQGNALKLKRKLLGLKGARPAPPEPADSH